MLNDKQYDDVIKQLFYLYQDIEAELLENVAKRLPLHDELGGTLEWQMGKLNELGALNQENIKVIAKYAKVSEQMVRDVIERCKFGSINTKTMKQAFDDGAIKVNPAAVLNSTAVANIVDRVDKEAQGMLKLIQTKALESARDSYMRTINMAYLETASGIYDYQTSIRRALVKLADSGIRGATYKRADGTIVTYSIEAAVRRDTLTAAHKVANEVSLKVTEETGANHVEVSSHMGARPSHAEWQGKVYQLVGSSKEYPNFKLATGYGTVTGLGGVNCRHSFYSFWPGISERSPYRVNQAENDRVYALSQQQRALERSVRNQKKRLVVQSASDDKEAFAKTSVELKERERALKAFVSQHKELKYDGSRVQVQDFGKSIAQKAVWANKAYTDYDNLVGNVTSNNIEITRVADHFTERAISRNVPVYDVKDALINPLKIGNMKIETKVGNDGQDYTVRSIKLIGEKSTVTINPDDGTLVTVYPTGSKELKKLKGGK